MRIQKKLLLGVVVFVLTFSSVIGLIPPQTAYAAINSPAQAQALIKTLKFKNSNTITGNLGGTITFTTGDCKKDPNGDEPIGINPNRISCFVTTQLPCNDRNTEIIPDGSGGYNLRYTLETAGSCGTEPRVLPIGKIPNPNNNQGILVSSLNDNVLFSSGGEKFVKSTYSDNVYVTENEPGEKCKDFVQVVTKGNNWTGTLYRIGPNEGSPSANDARLNARDVNTVIYSSPEVHCKISNVNAKSIGILFKIGGQDTTKTWGQMNNEEKNQVLGEIRIAASPIKIGKITAEEAAALQAQDSSNGSISCESTSSGALGWVLCPVIEMAGSFTEFVFENFVIPFLEDVPVSTDPQNGTYIAWNQFRTLGNIVLVGTMIAVVYAQVRGDR